MHKNSYQIVLTQDEINTLFVLIGNVRGDDKLSPREHCDTIFYRLKDMLGELYSELPERKLLSQSAKFNNYPVTKTPQQLKIEELEATIASASETVKEAQKQLEELKGL